MATLKHLSTGTEHRLTANHLVGRAPTCNLVLDSSLVSNRHAELLWNGSGWEIHDLGSLNGTFVNDVLLGGGGRATIVPGARIGFGERNDAYQLVDAAPPSAFATNRAGRVLMAEDGLLVLPDPDNPVYTIFDEAGGNWLAEGHDGSQHPVNNGATLAVANEVWTLELPTVVEGTLGPDADVFFLSRMRVQLRVSRDHENVEMLLIQGSREQPLESRAYSYMLLLLARARQEDQADPKIDPDEEGWLHVVDLVSMLGTNENQLNVAICRARKQFARLGVRHATELIERRVASREIRIGIQNIEIFQS